MSTIDDLFAFTNPFGAPSKGKWNLTPATWIDSVSKVQTTFFFEVRSKDDKGALTAVDQISDTGGRRHAIYEYPYVDGQKVKDLGRKAETYTFNVKFFGPNYQTKLKEFYDNVYRSRNSGKLTHPVMNAIRGAVDCRLQTFEPVHRADEQNAVTFRAVFIEDNSAALDYAQSTNPDTSPETALQKALQFLVSSNAAISNGILAVSGLAATPAALIASLQAQRQGVIGRASALLGKLAATFSSSGNSSTTLAQSSNLNGGVAGASAGSVATRSTIGTTQLTNVPPAFQVGLDSNAQAFVLAQNAAFVNANQITTQEAVFESNQGRAGISKAIAAAEDTFGNDAYDIVLAYRAIAVVMQETVESCVTSAQSRVKIYSVLRPMSLRAVAYANGLDPDRSADIEALNPYLESVNFVSRGTRVVVPAS